MPVNFTTVSENVRHVLLMAKHPFVMLTPFAMVVVPLPETLKSVVVPVPLEVEEPIMKMVLVAEPPEFEWIESFEEGDVVPMPTVPLTIRPSIGGIEPVVVSAYAPIEMPPFVFMWSVGLPLFV
jgi:hypothetical protein